MPDEGPDTGRICSSRDLGSARQCSALHPKVLWELQRPRDSPMRKESSVQRRESGCCRLDNPALSVPPLLDRQEVPERATGRALERPARRSCYEVRATSVVVDSFAYTTVYDVPDA